MKEIRRGVCFRAFGVPLIFPFLFHWVVLLGFFLSFVFGTSVGLALASHTLFGIRRALWDIKPVGLVGWTHPWILPLHEPPCWCSAVSLITTTSRDIPPFS